MCGVFNCERIICVCDHIVYSRGISNNRFFDEKCQFIIGDYKKQGRNKELLSTDTSTLSVV